MLSNHSFLVGVLLGIALGLVVALALFHAFVAKPTSNIAVSFSLAEIRSCIETDAPMWSDSWCESCYALWSEVNESQ